MKVRELENYAIYSFGYGDLVTTMLFTNTGGIHLEANPFLRYMFLRFGVMSFIPIKIAAIIFILYWLEMLPKEKYKIPALAIMFTLGVYATANNLLILV